MKLVKNVIVMSFLLACQSALLVCATRRPKKVVNEPIRQMPNKEQLSESKVAALNNLNGFYKQAKAYLNSNPTQDSIKALKESLDKLKMSLLLSFGIEEESIEVVENSGEYYKNIEDAIKKYNDFDIDKLVKMEAKEFKAMISFWSDSVVNIIQKNGPIDKNIGKRFSDMASKITLDTVNKLEEINSSESQEKEEIIFDETEKIALALGVSLE